jgi:hypothetical protein
LRGLSVVSVVAAASSLAAFGQASEAGLARVTVACRGGTATPISSGHVFNALKKHNYSVHGDPNGCGGAPDGVMLYRTCPTVTHRETVVCFVRRRPIYGPGFHRIGKTAAMTAHLVQDNVECALYATQRPQLATHKLAATMGDMIA